MFSDTHFRSNPMDIDPSSAAAAAAVPINNPNPHHTEMTNPNPHGLIKSSAFRSVTSHTNGQVGPPLLKHNVHPLAAAAAVGYKECLKNHAASRGGHALDGCGEFFLDPTSDPADPTTLKCAACGCHRNFHRRSDALLNSYSPRAFVITPTCLLPLPHQSSSPSRSASPATTLSHHSPPPVSQVPPGAASFFNGAQMVLVNPAPLDETKMTSSDPSTARKRSRTKFSGEQKEKMLGFAETLGWRMERSKEGLVGEFCDQVGIGRNVFKVWMNNNKSRIINNNNNIKQRFEENNNKNNKNEINVNVGDDGQHQRFYISNNGGSNSSSS